MPETVTQTAEHDLHSEVAAIKAELESLFRVTAEVGDVENRLVSLQDLTVLGGSSGGLVLAVLVLWFHYRGKRYACEQAKVHGYWAGRSERMNCTMPGTVTISDTERATLTAMRDANQRAGAAAAKSSPPVTDARKTPGE